MTNANLVLIFSLKLKSFYGCLAYGLVPDGSNLGVVLDQACINWIDSRALQLCEFTENSNRLPHLSNQIHNLWTHDHHTCICMHHPFNIISSEFLCSRRNFQEECQVNHEQVLLGAVDGVYSSLYQTRVMAYVALATLKKRKTIEEIKTWLTISGNKHTLSWNNWKDCKY